MKLPEQNSQCPPILYYQHIAIQNEISIAHVFSIIPSIKKQNILISLGW